MFKHLHDSRVFVVGISLISLLLSIFQLSSFRVDKYITQSEIELIEMDQRMKAYPPKYYRLANILEKRSEGRLIHKLEQNFFQLFDFDYRYYALSPLFLIGLFKLIRDQRKLLLVSTLAVPLIALTLVTYPHNNYFIIYPFLFVAGTYAFTKK